ncbi:MAG: hypothetical protein Q8R90_06040 [Bacteroidales bacterium]|nr:hypothetical protein [Bacteroidales bacterium]
MMLKKLPLLSLLFLFLSFTASYGQTKEQLLGIRASYNISGVDSRPDMDYTGVTTYQNYSIVYTNYHSLWGTINRFGFQAAISKIEQGFISGEEISRFEVISVPLISQFHIDFWKMRLLINAGGFGGYRYHRVNSDGSGFDDFDNRIDYGFIAGGGVAFIFKPFEIHLEGNYQYSLSYLHNPKKFSETDYLFTYPHQLLISLSLNIHLKR